VRRASGGSQTEEANHWFEIAIVVQQGVATLNAVRADDQVVSRMNCNAPGAQDAKVPGCLHSNVFTQHRNDIEYAQLIPALLSGDRFCPGAAGDRGDAVGHLYEFVPSVAASLEMSSPTRDG